MAVRLETTKSRRNPQLRTSCSWKRHWIVRFCLHELPNEIPEQILTRGEYLVSFPRGGEADFVPIRWLTIAFTRIPSRSRGIPASVSSPVHFTIGICSTSSAESGYLRFTGREQNSLVNSSHHAGPSSFVGLASFNSFAFVPGKRYPEALFLLAQLDPNNTAEIFLVYFCYMINFQ